MDHEIVEVKPTNTREVFGLAAKKKTTRRPPKRTVAKPPPPPPEEPAYTVIRGGSIQEQKSPTESNEKGSKQ